MVTNRSQTDLEQGHELVGVDLANDGDVTLRVNVYDSDALSVDVNETSGGSLDVSIDFENLDGNLMQSLSASDLNLSGVTEASKEVRARARIAVVTFSNNTSATSTNAYVDTLP